MHASVHQLVSEIPGVTVPSLDPGRLISRRLFFKTSAIFRLPIPGEEVVSWSKGPIQDGRVHPSCSRALPSRIKHSRWSCRSSSVQHIRKHRSTRCKENGKHHLRPCPSIREESMGPKHITHRKNRPSFGPRPPPD
jgi:hypothetical protein